MVFDIDTEEFHNLMMDYRASSPIFAHKAYQRVIDYINHQISQQGSSHD